MIIKNLQDFPKISVGRAKNLVNKKFFMLKPLYRTVDYLRPSGRSATQWVCKCDCGNYTTVLATNLQSGYSKSCGCFRKQIQSKDITNQRFGKLIALYPTQKRNSDGSIIWHCKCDCGNQCDVIISNLRNGHTISCGCFSGSLGEEKISSLLNKEKIFFERQKTFNSCRFKETNQLARFDFYVNNSYLIEFDGKQHFQYSGFGWDNKENFKQTQKRDLFKNQWCKENNIPLIRIPYTKLKTLNIKDLLLETTQFLIK